MLCIAAGGGGGRTSIERGMQPLACAQDQIHQTAVDQRPLLRFIHGAQHGHQIGAGLTQCRATRSIRARAIPPRPVPGAILPEGPTAPYQ